MPGSVISAPEVTNISKHGLWLLVDDQERFLAFADFPWFREATVDAILRVERPMPDHLHWPDLNVDLSLNSIEHPERYPLKSAP